MQSDLGRDCIPCKRLPTPKTVLNIATYNVRTLSEEIHLSSIETEIKNINWVYAPTSVSSQEELDNFYDGLYTHYNIIMGDFNAKIGQGNEDCVGKFGYGERNERGDDLINFAVAHDFKIMNTFYQKSENERWTWPSPNHGTRNEIDYILGNKHIIVKNVDVLNQVNIELKNRYEILENLEDQNSYENDLENLNNNIIITLKEVAKRFQDRKPSDNSKFSEETKNLMKKRRNLKPPSTVKEKIEAAEPNKTIQKKQREDLRNRTTEIIEDVIKKGRGRQKTLWRDDLDQHKQQ
ncbi:craniofacial development protein 2-like [Macrobrachium rosenbergii]|uniref:craniofacial development protein 2-like n=1 Tax=Macrobrachium rosenbergii TaxID=79674 RepID=UPI0034D64004